MQQLNLVDVPPIAPTMPPKGLVMTCLRAMLSGRPLDAESFYRATASMRLPAYVETLHRLGWPILIHYENRGANRNFAVYRLDMEALAEVMTLLKAHLGKNLETLQ